MAEVERIVLYLTNGDRFCYKARNEGEVETLVSIYTTILRNARSKKLPITSHVMGAASGGGHGCFCYSGKSDELITVLIDVVTDICSKDDSPHQLLANMVEVSLEILKDKLTDRQKKNPLK